MQTFLPSADFSESMRCLDPKRLGNQIYREGMTLLRGGWPNHPASKIWRDYPDALVNYLLCGVKELRWRGHNYTDRPWCIELQDRWDNREDDEIKYPPWLGDQALHASHRGVLLYKDTEWYSQFGWKEAPRAPLPNGKQNYVWPEITKEAIA